MKQVERFTIRQVFVGIQDLDFRNQSGALQRERCVAAYATATTDDAYFHGITGPRFFKPRLNGIHWTASMI